MKKNPDKKVFRQENGGFIYSDGFIEIFVGFEQRNELHWRFRNLGRELVTLNPDKIRLGTDLSLERYGFFGDRSGRLLSNVNYSLKSGEFIDLRFPLRPSSALFKESFLLSGKAWLELSLLWGIKNYQYHIEFPKSLNESAASK